MWIYTRWLYNVSPHCHSLTMTMTQKNNCQCLPNVYSTCLFSKHGTTVELRACRKRSEDINGNIFAIEEMLIWWRIIEWYMWKWNKPVCRGPLLLCELTFPGMKQQRLESTYFMKVMLSRERRVSTAARMSAWRASEWFLLSDSLLETNDEKQGEDLSHFYQLIAVIKMFNHLELCITTSQRALMCPCSTNINHTSYRNITTLFS